MTSLFEEKHEEWITIVLQTPRNLASELELQEQAKVAHRRFLEADIDQSEYLSYTELKRLCDDMGLPMGDDEEEALMKMDTDGNGTLDMEEWVLWWLKRVSCLPNPMKQQEAIAKNTFAKFDADNSGYLNISELKMLIETLGADFNEEEMQAALDEIDTDGTGSIECNEFIAWWTNRASGSRGSSSLISLKLRKLAAKAQKQFHTDIFKASWLGDIALVQSFLDQEKRLAQAADDAEFADLWSPLQYACYQGHIDIVRLLLRSGATVNYANAFGFTALFYAAQQGHLDICAELYQHGADPSLYGLQEDNSPQCLCPVDFISFYPSLRQLFEGHKRVSEPEVLKGSDVRQSTINASGLLSLDIATSAKSVGLPITAYKVQLTAVSSDINNSLTMADTELTVPVLRSSTNTTSILNGQINSTWWEGIIAGYYLHKINTLRLLHASIEGVAELWKQLSSCYASLDIRRQRKIDLENSLYSAIEREINTEAIQLIIEQLRQHMQKLAEEAAKAAKDKTKVRTVQEQLDEAVILLGSEQQRGKSKSKAGGSMSEGRAGPMTGYSNRAPWALTMRIAVVNAWQTSAVSEDMPVKVVYPRLS